MRQSPHMRKSRLMSVSQAATALGESSSTIVRRIEAGTLPAEKLDGRKGMYLIERELVARLVVERAAELREEVKRLEALESAAS